MFKKNTNWYSWIFFFSKVQMIFDIEIGLWKSDLFESQSNQKHSFLESIFEQKSTPSWLLKTR